MILDVFSMRRSASLLAICASILLAGCNGEEANDPTPTHQEGGAPAGSTVVLDQESISPAGGDVITVHAKVLGKDGSEINGFDIVWSSTNPSVAKILSASNLAPSALGMGGPDATAAGAFARVLVGDAGGNATLTATLGLSDGTIASRALRVSAVPKPAAPGAPAHKTYRLAVSPGAFTLASSGSPQVAAAVATDVDGTDSTADLRNWSWHVDDNSKFVVAAAEDGYSATIRVADGITVGVAGTLTVCADTSTGNHLCANAALARPPLALPSISFNAASVSIKPGRSQPVLASLNEAPGQNGLIARGATYAWSLDRDSTFGSLSTVQFERNAIEVAANAENLSPWNGTLSLTVTYPDGRSNSASLPVVSSGPWTRLPAPAGKVVQGIALKDNVAILLSTDGAGAAIDRIEASTLSPFRIYTGPWPDASNLWVSEDTNYVVAELSTSSGQMGALPIFGGSTLQRVPNMRCAVGESRSSYTVKEGQLNGITWCPNGPRNVYYTHNANGLDMVRSLPVPTDGVSTARAFPDGTFAVLTENGTMVGDIGSTGEVFTPNTSSFAESTCVFKPWGTARGTMLICAANAGYSVLSWYIGTPYWVNEYDKLYAVSPSEMQSDGTFLYSLYTFNSSQTVTVSRAAHDTFDAGRPNAVPASATVKRFVTSNMQVGGITKARIGLIFSDGSAWLYDQP